MADTAGIEHRAETTARGKTSPGPAEKAPPRPADMPATPSKAGGRADVNIHTDSREHVRLAVDKHEGGGGAAASGNGGGWPRDADEWKALLFKAAPWLAAAAIVAASAYGAYQQRENGTAARDKARRKADRAAAEAAQGARRTWFGLKRRAESTADTAGERAQAAKKATGKKAEDVKQGGSRAAEAARGTARGATDAAGSAASRAAARTGEAADAAKGAARDAAASAKRGAADVTHSVKEGAEQAADVAADKADASFFMWKKITRGVKEQYGRAKEEAKHVAGEAASSAKHAVHDTAAGAKHGAQAAGRAAHDAADWTREKAGDAADAARHAERATEESAYKGVARGVADAGAGQETAGKVMREAGSRLEKQGRETRQYYGGEAVEPEAPPAKKRWLWFW